VEALKATEQNAKPQIVAVLSKGDSFGEAMLTGNRQHETSVRARTAVRLTQIGSDLFSQRAGPAISGGACHWPNRCWPTSRWHLCSILFLQNS
jgi:CRP-like cAMP-binding protein